MKRKYVLVFLLSVLILSVHAVENTDSIYYQYFTYPGIEDGIDPQTGNREVALGDFDNFFNRNKLKKVEITWLRYEKGKLNQFIREEYSNGLVVSKYSDYYEKETTNYLYDSLRRIIKVGDLWTYKYFDDIPKKQESYYKNTLSRTNIITLLPDGFEIESISNNVSNRRRTTKANGVIVKIVKSNDEGTEELWYDFSYENNLLNKIVCARVSKDDIRQITTVKKYNGKNIAELETIYYKDYASNLVDLTNVDYFTDYDKYGNWHTSERYRNGKLISKNERKIEYIE